MSNSESNIQKENVWDYPRPPRLEEVTKEIKIIFNGVVIALTTKAYRILETSHPPTYYIPLQDIKSDYLIESSAISFCEWKGQAKYYDLQVKDKLAKKVCWYYPEPSKKYKKIKNFVAFYAEPMDACYVGSEKVMPQSGNFYGGWITSNLIGPFKGIPGSMGW